MIATVKSNTKHEGCWHKLTPQIVQYLSKQGALKNRIDLVKGIGMSTILAIGGIISIATKKSIGLIPILLLALSVGIAVITYKTMMEYTSSLRRVLSSSEAEYALVVFKEIKMVETTNSGIIKTKHARCNITLGFDDGDETYTGTVEPFMEGEKILVVKMTNVSQFSSKFCFKFAADPNLYYEPYHPPVKEEKGEEI